MRLFFYVIISYKVYKIFISYKIMIFGADMCSLTLNNNEIYKHLFNYSMDAVFITGPSGIIYEANPASVEMLGWTEDEICRLGREGIVDTADTEFARLLEERQNTGECFGIIQLKRKNGTTFPAEISSRIFQLENGEFRSYIIARDLTEKKISQELFKEAESFNKKILRAAPIGIATYDSNGTCTYVNDHFAAIIGAPRNNLLTQNFKTIPSWKKYGLYDLAELALKEGVEIRKELEVVTTFGKDIWIDLTFSSFISHGELNLLMMIANITERKIADQFLKQSENKLKELNDAKDKFFSIIAHDLKSPVSNFVGITQLLTESDSDISDKEAKEYIKESNKAARDLLNLLDNLLQWANGQSGLLDFSPERFELKKILRESIDIFRNIAIKKNIAITSEVNSDTEVYADKNMISTVVRNLLANAVKFTNPGGEIIIKITPEESFTTISIEDNGVGIPPENIKKMFSLGEKVTTLGTNKERGTGLGLILCKNFIERNNGSFRLESEVGKGSKFYFTLPTSK